MYLKCYLIPQGSGLSIPFQSTFEVLISLFFGLNKLQFQFCYSLF